MASELEDIKRQLLAVAGAADTARRLAQRIDEISASIPALHPMPKATPDLNVDDLAARWKCTRGQIYKMARDGKLPCLRIAPKMLRFDLEAVEAFEAAARGKA